MRKNELIAFEWLSHDSETMTRVETRFKPVGEAETIVFHQ